MIFLSKRVDEEQGKLISCKKRKSLTRQLKKDESRERNKSCGRKKNMTEESNLVETSLRTSKNAK